ncbi:hypothetical protein WCH_BS10280, partial [Waddlia chondrophila 2032/99]
LGEMSPRLCNHHLANYPATRSLYLELSSHLHLIPCVETFSPLDCSECPSCHQLVLKRDLDSLWGSYKCPFCKEWVKIKQWLLCSGPCVNSGYFQKCNQFYFHFFQHFLQYCSENPDCQCYWPENKSIAAGINQDAISLANFLEGHRLLFNDFSPYWDQAFAYKGKSLATYTFFYSQHHQVCLDLAKYVNAAGASAYETFLGFREVDNFLEKITERYLKLYSKCLLNHPHPKIYYERGMVHMHVGNTEEALQDIRALMELANSDKYKDQDLITSEMYRQEGAAYNELGMYDQAIEVLTRAIVKDPHNLEAYFQRASAYFEIGDFDRSLEDYIISKKSGRLILDRLPSIEFMDAFCAAAINGSCETACDFAPSLCHTIYGLGKCLWTFGEHPIDCISHLAGAGYEMAECIVSYLKTVDKETLHEYADELVRLYENFNQLSDHEKGELIGFTVGKYGVSIFAGSATIKGVAAYKKLKEANRVCNLESMVLSLSSKEGVASKGVQHYAERSKFFEESKIHWGRQNKHVPGSNNYDPAKKRSIWTHPDADGLLKKCAGTGNSKQGIFGQPGYKEVVDFKENIGIWQNLKGESLPTTKGTIHYSNHGAHIVPAHPESKVW